MGELKQTELINNNVCHCLGQLADRPVQCLHHCAAIVILIPTAPLGPIRVCCSGPNSSP